MRPYIKGEDLSKMFVGSTEDPETDMGMIARDSKDYTQQWYVSRRFFEIVFEEVIPLVKDVNTAI